MAYDRRMRRNLPLFLSAALLLASCGTARVLTATESAISVDVAGTQWTASEMLKNATAIAEAHCAKFNKKPNMQGTSGFMGAASVVHFTCR
jgi:hypothetical protein